MPQLQITWSLHVPSSLSALKYHLCWYGVKSNNKMWDVMRNTLALLCWKSNTVCILNYKTIPSCIQSLFLSTFAVAAIQFSLNHENLKSYSCLLLPSSLPSPSHFFFSKLLENILLPSPGGETTQRTSRLWNAKAWLLFVSQSAKAVHRMKTSVMQLC